LFFIYRTGGRAKGKKIVRLYARKVLEIRLKLDFRFATTFGT
jgi:hypothetical protein